MFELHLRTEDIEKESIEALYVGTDYFDVIVEKLKTSTPVILEGSRGSGKSFLMTKACLDLDSDPALLPIYITLMESSLVHTNDKYQFRHWMLSKVLKALIKALRLKNFTVSSIYTLAPAAGGASLEQELSKLIDLYENSYKNPYQDIDTQKIPSIEDFKEFVDEVCQQCKIKRIHLFFDEAAHIFRPEQQRQFFSLFRDLRSSRISCKAAVYPGVTHYGATFELTHDATLLQLDYDINQPDYKETMYEMVRKQLNANEIAILDNNKAVFDSLAHCAAGNPRILFKTLTLISKFNEKAAEAEIRRFYREEIWSEHTRLGEKYHGHKQVIDSGREFLEKNVLKQMEDRLRDAKNPTNLFLINKDAPYQVKEALRLLCYTGIVRKIDDGVRATRSQVGTRYEVKFGCVLAQVPNPLSYAEALKFGLTLKRFIEFGMNHPSFSIFSFESGLIEKDVDILDALREQLKQPLAVLDLTPGMSRRLINNGICTLQDLLDTSEEDLKKIDYIGNARARRIKNSLLAEMLEYVSG